MIHAGPGCEDTPADREAVRELQGLAARLLGLPDAWSAILTQRNALASGLLRHLVADGRGAALRDLGHGFDTAGPTEDAADVLAKLGEGARSVARTIMAAWLLARYLPAEPEGLHESVYPDIMGAEAYRQSLVWHLIGATPMGVPQGSDAWAGPPRILT